MSAFDVAEGRILIALFIDHHDERRKILRWEDIEARYHTKVSKMQFEAIVGELEQAGVVKVFRDKDGSGVLLLDHGIRFAHDKILQFLMADTFEVNWKGERIVTDAPEETDIPSPNGWMLIKVDKDSEKESNRDAAPDVANRTKTGVEIMRTIVPSLSGESGWVKWQTVLTAIGVIVAIIAIFVATK